MSQEWSLEGAQTMAMDSLSMSWYEPWVWRSTEDMKHDWVGWVWIHPSRIRSCVSKYSNNSSSWVVWHVSGVDSWWGIIRWVMKKAFLLSLPQSMPHVSRRRLVLDRATFKKSTRRALGRNTERRGVPPSVWERILCVASLLVLLVAVVAVSLERVAALGVGLAFGCNDPGALSGSSC